MLSQETNLMISIYLITHLRKTKNKIFGISQSYHKCAGYREIFHYRIGIDAYILISLYHFYINFDSLIYIFFKYLKWLTNLLVNNKALKGYKQKIYSLKIQRTMILLIQSKTGKSQLLEKNKSIPDSIQKEEKTSFIF